MSAEAGGSLGFKANWKIHESCTQTNYRKEAVGKAPVVANINQSLLADGVLPAPVLQVGWAGHSGLTLFLQCSSIKHSLPATSQSAQKLTPMA